MNKIKNMKKRRIKRLIILLTKVEKILTAQRGENKMLHRIKTLKREKAGINKNHK